MEAIAHAGTVLAVLSKEGIALAAEKVNDFVEAAWSWLIHFRKSQGSF
jgi:hypothetical protein